MTLLRTVLVFLFFVSPVIAQQPDAQQPPPAPAASQADNPKSVSQDPPKRDDATASGKEQQGSPPVSTEQDKNAATSKDRLFYTLPNFLTLENGGQVPPLTAGQKFKVVARSSFDYVQYPWYGFLAGISQAENSEPGYGQGAQGYGKRFGATIADGTIENFITSAVLPSVFHQDPRFFQNGKGGFWHRTSYAVSRLFITRADSGNSQINYSEIFGSALAAGISTYGYHPHDDKTVKNTLSVWGSQVGYDSLSYFVKEFWPDIRRKFRHEKSPASSSALLTRDSAALF